MKVKFLVPKGFHKIGTVADLPEDDAERLIKRGIVEAVIVKSPKKESSKDQTKSKSKLFGGDE